MDKETKELYIDLYKENQTFLNKALFTLSSAALPIILNLGEDVVGCGRVTVFISFVLFTIVICLHLYTHFVAKEGCDLALSNDYEKASQAENLFEKVRRIEVVKYSLFVCALLSILFIFGQSEKEINMTKLTKTNLSKGAIPPKYVNNGAVPPKAISRTPKPSKQPSPTPVKKP